MSIDVTDDEPELDAMKTILSALTPLDEDARDRVVGYVLSRLEISPPGSRQTARERNNGARINPEYDEDADSGANDHKTGGGAYPDFAALCIAATPKTDAEKALVAGYWFQVCQERDGFVSQGCNDELKNFGTPIGNITRAFDQLKAKTPKLAVQVQKSGKGKQARKKYRLTHQGISEVESMLNG